jgi:hypothetical protein
VFGALKSAIADHQGQIAILPTWLQDPNLSTICAFTNFAHSCMIVDPRQGALRETRTCNKTQGNHRRNSLILFEKKLGL